MITENREGYHDFDIDDDWSDREDVGISAMLRVGNEEEWIGPCLESIVNFFDEIVVTINCNDRTREIIDSFDDPKISVYEYPFDINPNGPGHDDYPAGSVHDRAYYYNWSLSKTTRTYVSKWDADMLLLPSYNNDDFYEAILEHEIVFMRGWEVVEPDFSRISMTNPTTGNEVRVFRVTPHLHYRQGRVCENFTYPASSVELVRHPRLGVHRVWNILTGNELEFDEPTFLHTKHIKSTDKQAWPDDWEERDHFQWIDERKVPGDPLDIEVPEFCFKGPEDYLQ